jgi:hypothetical protein
LNGPWPPAAIGPADAAPLRAQGLGDLEILDLSHSVRVFPLVPAKAHLRIGSRGKPNNI